MSGYKVVPVEPTAEMLNRVCPVAYSLETRGPQQDAEKVKIAQDYHAPQREAMRSIYKAMLAAAPAVQGEPVAWQPVDELRFEYRHPKTGEAYTVSLSREEVMEMMDQELFEKLTACFCECEPIGETNVVDCRCDEYADQFELVTAPQPAGLQSAPEVASLVDALDLALEYWRDRQQRYKNRKPRWVTDAESALAAHRKQGGEV